MVRSAALKSEVMGKESRASRAKNELLVKKVDP